MTDATPIPCFGCGALVPDIDGQTHPYMGSAPGCWALYSEVLGREYGEFNYPAVHRLCVDAYAVQHPRPGVDQPGESRSRKAIQSVAAHLIAMHFTLERGFSEQQVLAAIRRAVADAKLYHELEPPSFAGCMTIADVARPPAADVQDHSKRVRDWAASLWQAWSPHHDTIRQWAQRNER